MVRKELLVRLVGIIIVSSSCMCMHAGCPSLSFQSAVHVNLHTACLTTMMHISPTIVVRFHQSEPRKFHVGYFFLGLDSFATHAHPMIWPECQEIASLTQSLQDVSKRLANAASLSEPWVGHASCGSLNIRISWNGAL